VVSVSTLPDHEFDERVVAAVMAHTRARGIEIEVLRPAAIPTPATLAREGQELVMQWGARGAVWIDLTTDGTSTLYLAEPTRDRVYRRALPGTGAGSAQAESVANVVSAVIAAILEGQLAVGEAPAGLDVVEPAPGGGEPVPDVVAPPPPATPVPPSAPAPRRADTPSWPRLRLVAGYIGGTFAAALPWQSGPALAVGWRPTARVHLDLGYAVMFGPSVRNEYIELSIRRHPISLAGGHAWSVGRIWDLRLGGRFAVDILARRAGRRSSEVTLTGDHLRLSTSLGVFVGAGVRPTPAVRLALAVGVEGVLNRTDYTIYIPARVVLVAPFPVRFLATATLEFELLRATRGAKKV